MSHNQHPLSAHSQAAPTSPAEYGVALPQRPPPLSRSAPAPTVEPPLVPPTTVAVAATASTIESAVDSLSPSSTAAMPDDVPPHLQLTYLERWAVDASDSRFNALAGAIGGFASGIVTCPLDVIKTKLQAQGGFSTRGAHQTRVYKGLFGTASVIWREEGLRGMYRGLGPIIMGYLPTWAVWFTVYNKTKKVLGEYHSNSFVVNFWSSIIAGASSTVATNPIWVIKTRLMSQSNPHSRSASSIPLLPPKGPGAGNTPTSRPVHYHPWHYKSTWDAARKMYTTEGILSFYSGLTPALLGLTHVAVQFPAYEFLKVRFTGRAMGASAPEGEDDKGHWFGILSASILSKILASSATYPHEVIRTRLQTQRRPIPGQEYMEGLGGLTTQPAMGNGVSLPEKGSSEVKVQHQGPKYKGIISTFRTMLREEGWRAFYAGMGTNMMRAVPAATVTMLTYEYVMRRLNHVRASGNGKLAMIEAGRGEFGS